MSRGSRYDDFDDDDVPRRPQRRRPKRRKKKSNAPLIIIIVASSIGGLAVLVGLGFLLFNAVGSKTFDSSGRRQYCKNNLKQIGLALHNYHDVYRSFPAAYIADKEGKPMHSWRVLALQFLGPEEQALFEAYRFDEPWNGPNNSRLADKMPDCYRCPSSKQDSPLTHYVIVRGPDTLFPGAETRRLRDVIDGTSNTVMVVESMKAVHWMAPDDTTPEEFFNSIRTAGADGSHHRDVFHLLRVDGSVSWVPMDPNEAVLNGMLTIRGKEDIRADVY
jgi:hypothetical protein